MEEDEDARNPPPRSVAAKGEFVMMVFDQVIWRTKVLSYNLFATVRVDRGCSYYYVASSFTWDVSDLYVLSLIHI